MYKNKVENDRKSLKFPLFYLANRKSEWENSKYIPDFEFFRSGFPNFKKILFVLFPIFIHILLLVILNNSMIVFK